MSDYLSNLAARSVNLAAVIQPRLASRFEAARAHDMLGVPLAVSSLTEEEGMAEAPTDVSILLPQEQRIEPKATAPDDNVLRTSPLPKTQISFPKARDTASVAVPRSEERSLEKNERRGELPPLVRTSPRERQPLLPTLPAQPQAVLPADHVVLSPEAQPLVAESIPQSTESEQQPTRQPIISSITHVVVERATEHSVTTQEQLATHASQSVVVRPRVALAERQGNTTANIGTGPARVHEQPPAPTIHVSIGRIEVRATGPGAPAPKLRSASQTRSLDDYLRRRSSGGRQ